MDGAAANKLADQESKINLAALRKSDQFVVNILETSAQVALYRFDPVKQEWEKTEVEGSLFLYRRSTLPKYALTIMNRLNRENLNETISKEMEFKVEKPFLLYKNSSMDILGIWFNNSEKCEKVGELITRLYASPTLPPPPSQPKVKTKENGQSILDLFANAQRKYDEENKVIENGFVETSSSKDTHALEEKPRSMSLTAAPPPQSSPSVLLPSAVENEETQALHDPCIVKSSPLRTSQGPLSCSLPNTAKKTSQRQLFSQDTPPLLPNQFPSEKALLTLMSSQNASGRVAASKPLVVTKQRSVSDLNMAAATPLMSPMAFKTTKNHPPKDTNVDAMPTLTKEQLQGTLIALLETDSDFLDKIHRAYLKNANR